MGGDGGGGGKKEEEDGDQCIYKQLFSAVHMYKGRPGPRAQGQPTPNPR